MEYKLSYVSRNPGVSPSQQAAIATPLLTDTDSSLNFNNPSNLFTSENDEAEELPTETVPVENFMYNHSGINPEISNVTNAKYTTTVINDTVHNQRVANKNIHSNNENEIDLSDVEKIKEIGHGHFGDVYFALLKDRDGKEMPVAVKRSKISADTRTLTEEQRAEIYHQQLKSLQCEQNIMSSIGSHPNILKLIGAVTKRPEDFCVVTEYCEYGSLDKFLQGRKDEEKFVNDYIVQSADGYQLNSLEFRWKTQDDSSWGANYESRRKEGIVATSDLMWFSLQIAEAMEFLSNQSILHRDIALRNMLLASGYIVKVADFGLSRKIENDLYQPSNTFALPIAYLAPEIIRDRQFSSKSESWAFGIVLWELFTLAEHLPYVKECGGMDAWAISAFLGANKRLPIPEITPISMRWLITQLWSKNSDSRPDFVVCQSTIMEELQNANPQLADHAEKMWNPNWNPGLSLSNQRTPYEKSEISINLNEASETNKRAFRRNWISKFRTVRTLWCFLPIALGLLLFSAYFGIRSIIRTDNQAVIDHKGFLPVRWSWTFNASDVYNKEHKITYGPEGILDLGSGSGCRPLKWQPFFVRQNEGNSSFKIPFVLRYIDGPVNQRAWRTMSLTTGDGREIMTGNDPEKNGFVYESLHKYDEYVWAADSIYLTNSSANDPLTLKIEVFVKPSWINCKSELTV
uniref:Protein kinase domain-containing protein n=1 Tax=Plectus sambesii TaxID=2011161 RepID=A0A914W6T2_9BILA